jgi:hypothetical protein
MFFDKEDKIICQLQIFDCEDGTIIVPGFIGDWDTGCQHVSVADYNLMKTELHKYANLHNAHTLFTLEGDNKSKNYSNHIKFKEYYLLNNVDSFLVGNEDPVYMNVESGSRGPIYTKPTPISNRKIENPAYEGTKGTTRYNAAQAQVARYQELPMRQGEQGEQGYMKVNSGQQQPQDTGYVNLNAEKGKKYNTRTTENEN